MKEKIAYIADSCADLPKEIQEREDVFLMPMMVNCQDKEYRDGVDITAETVYEEQKNGRLPKTSLPVGEIVENVLKEVIEKGYKKAVVLTISSAISGTWNMCRLLCEECEELDCIVFDSKMASLAEGAVLIELIDEVDREELSWEQIPARLEELKKNTKPFFGIDTLEFLEKNGRIGKATALVGNLLNLMPILSFDEDGVIESVEKVRGKKQRLQHLKANALAVIQKAKRYRLYFVEGGCPEMVEKLKNEILAEVPELPSIHISSLGCALAVHLGKNLIGVCVQVIEEA